MSVRRVLILVGCATLATCSLDFESFSFDNTLPPTTASSSTASGTGAQGGTGFDQCDVPADCPGEDTTCQTRTCVAGMCGQQNAQAGTACTEDGGSMCNGLGACVECLTSDDCDPGSECENGQCVAFTCTDMTLNGDETDVDCGGSCPPCDNGEDCLAAADCTSGFCDNLVCAPCAVLGDCQPGNYCNNMVCTAQNPLGTACTIGDECVSGNCVDGVCCDTACGALCEACTMALSGGADGTCTPIPLTQDPEMECADPAYCQGNGTCGTCLLAVPPTGTTCPPECTGGCMNGICTIACDGSGECFGDSLICPAGFACEIECTAFQSCRDANIVCPADHQCNIVCAGNQACRDATVVCSSQGPCAITCDNSSSVCQAASVICGSNACTATCTGGSTPSLTCGGSCFCDAC